MKLGRVILGAFVGSILSVLLLIGATALGSLVEGSWLFIILAIIGWMISGIVAGIIATGPGGGALAGALTAIPTFIIGSIIITIVLVVFTAILGAVFAEVFTLGLADTENLELKTSAGLIGLSVLIAFIISAIQAIASGIFGMVGGFIKPEKKKEVIK